MERYWVCVDAGNDVSLFFGYDYYTSTCARIFQFSVGNLVSYALFSYHEWVAGLGIAEEEDRAYTLFIRHCKY